MMNNIMNYITNNIEIIHTLVGITSSVICLGLGIKLLLVRLCKYIDMKSPYRHSRYIAARKALGWAYIIIGVFSLALLFTVDVREQEHLDFFPIAGLIISISQIILFTVAALALFNSKLLNRTLIAANICPILLLLLVYALLSKEEQVGYGIRLSLFIIYLLQLVVYTFAFIIERKKYLLIIEDYFDDGKLYEKYSCKGVAILYFCAIGIGFWALASYFFNTLEQETLFIFSYTIYYIVVAWYYLEYSQISRRIQDVTTPEFWAKTEEYSKAINQYDKQSVKR